MFMFDFHVNDIDRLNYRDEQYRVGMFSLANAFVQYVERRRFGLRVGEAECDCSRWRQPVPKPSDGK